MKILIACEESQTVCKAFRKLGHEAYSCDILPCSGGHPEWHIQGDVLPLLEQHWDLIIAHPPCTYLSNAGAGSLFPKGILNEERYKLGLEAKDFFNKFLNTKCDRVCIENPIQLKIFGIPKYDQIIQPWMFGDEANKPTCLWLKNLPKLTPTKIVGKGEFVERIGKDGKKRRNSAWGWSTEFIKMSKADRQKARSKTFQGIADAMATQWGQL